jgi:cytochrome P450
VTEGTAADFDPLSPPADPWPALDELRSRCPLHLTASGMAMPVSYDSVTDVLNNPEVFSSRSRRPPADGEAEQIVHLDGTEHSRVRRLVNKALPKRVMSRCQPDVEAMVVELLAPLVPLGEFDLVSALSQPIPAIVFFRLLGLPDDDRKQFIEWADDAVHHSHAGAEAPSHGTFMAYVYDRIELTRQQPTDDILSRMVHSEVDGDRLTDAEVAAMVRILIIAGTETTTNAMSTLFHRLLAERELWEQVVADPALIPVAVEEALRIDPPLNWVPRICVEAATVAGVPVSAGVPIAANVGAGNHDPSHYDDPHRFRLDRPTSDPLILTFGAGAHYCLGAPLARTELKAALSVVTTTLPDLQIAAGYVFAPRGPVMMRGAESLPVRFAARGG